MKVSDFGICGIDNGDVYLLFKEIDSNNMDWSWFNLDDTVKKEGCQNHKKESKAPKLRRRNHIKNKIKLDKHNHNNVNLSTFKLFRLYPVILGKSSSNKINTGSKIDKAGNIKYNQCCPAHRWKKTQQFF